VSNNEFPILEELLEYIDNLEFNNFISLESISACENESKYDTYISVEHQLATVKNNEQAWGEFQKRAKIAALEGQKSTLDCQPLLDAVNDILNLDLSKKNYQKLRQEHNNLTLKAEKQLNERKKKNRGKQSFFNILNEVYAYNYLELHLNCSNINFYETPDLQAEKNGNKVLCEVKTIQQSDEEIVYQNEVFAGRTTPRSVNAQLSSCELCKVIQTLKKAEKQLHQAKEELKFDNTEKFIFIILNFDNSLSGIDGYVEKYISQIDTELELYKGIFDDIQIIFYLPQLVLRRPKSMQHARLVISKDFH